MNISGKKVLIVFVIVAGMFLVYFYGIERYFAVKYFDEYLRMQNVNEENIENKKIFKDWKMGGYKMMVDYSNNKDLVYIYHYSSTTHRRNEDKKYNVIHLKIVKDGNVLDEPYSSDVKYPPVKE